MQDDNDEYRPALDINITTRRCYSRRLAEMLRKHTGLRVLVCRLRGGQWVATVELRAGALVRLPVSDLLGRRGLYREVQEASTA